MQMDRLLYILPLALTMAAVSVNEHHSLDFHSDPNVRDRPVIDGPLPPELSAWF